MRFRVFNRLVLVAALAALTIASPAFAEKGKLRERLTPDVMASIDAAIAD